MGDITLLSAQNAVVGYTQMHPMVNVLHNSHCFCLAIFLPDFFLFHLDILSCHVEPGPLVQLGCGTVSGALGATCVYPLQVIRTR